jgi:hypothetical protein
MKPSFSVSRRSKSVSLADFDHKKGSAVGFCRTVYPGKPARAVARFA